MKNRKLGLLLVISAVFLLLTLLSPNAFAAYLKNEPQNLIQPDGTVLHCYASGDEYCNWLHDEEGRIIIQDPQSGYYVYAVQNNETLEPTNEIALNYDSSHAHKKDTVTMGAIEKTFNDSVGVSSRRTITQNILKAKAEGMDISSGQAAAANQGDMTNIVIFIKFQDSPDFADSIATYDKMFNSTDPSYKSMYNYYREVSFNKLNIKSEFYPQQSGSVIVSYVDPHPRGYYLKYNSSTNPIGYTDDYEIREQMMLKNAILAIQSQIPADANIDYDNDGYVDVVCFIVQGATSGWNSILWPHYTAMYMHNVSINGKRVWEYTFQVESNLAGEKNLNLCHEMFHVLGAPDLYHYRDNGIDPAYNWDIMDGITNPPVHMLNYMKWRYGRWIASNDFPIITSPGTYTLYPSTTEPTDNKRTFYEIISPYSSRESIVVEYRKKTGVFEKSVPGSGLIAYRIDMSKRGNADGPPDEVYVYRPGGTLTANGAPGQAHLTSDVGRTAAGNGLDMQLFLSDGTSSGIRISNVTSCGDTITFDVTFENAIAAPVFSIKEGTYNKSQMVSMSTTTSGAEIRYTTDGSEPTKMSSLYTSSVSISSTTTLKAKAFQSTFESDTSTAVYTIAQNLESEHPYANNLNYTWTYEYDGSPKAIVAEFSADTSVEEGLDFIYITSGAGNQVASSPFTSKALAGKSIVVPGNVIKINLVSNSSITDYGFKVNSVRAARSDADLSGIIINGKAAAGFDPSKTIYNVTLPYGTDTVSIAAVPHDSNASVKILPDTNTFGLKTIIVTAEDNMTTKTYRVRLSAYSAFSGTYTTRIDNSTKIVTITGNTPLGEGRSLTVQVVNAKTSRIAYLDQITSGVGGDFHISFKLQDDAEDGEYITSINGVPIDGYVMDPVANNFVLGIDNINFTILSVNQKTVNISDVSIVADVKNNTDSPRTMTIIIGIYDSDEKLAGIKILPSQNIDGGSHNEFSAVFDSAANIDGLTGRAFVMNSIEDLMPLTDSRVGNR